MKFSRGSERDKMPACVYYVSHNARVFQTAIPSAPTLLCQCVFQLFCNAKHDHSMCHLSWGQCKGQNTTASKTRANTVFNGYAQYEKL